MNALTLAACLACALVAAYAVWAARDVILKRRHNEDRVQKCEKAIENMAAEMREAILPLDRRVTNLETTKAGSAIAGAQRRWPG